VYVWVNRRAFRWTQSEFSDPYGVPVPHHCPSSASVSATTLLPGEENSAPSGPMAGTSGFVVSCGVRLCEVGVLEIRKPQVAPSNPGRRLPVPSGSLIHDS
jgi:hypothetical protein